MARHGTSWRVMEVNRRLFFCTAPLINVPTDTGLTNLFGTDPSGMRKNILYLTITLFGQRAFLVVEERGLAIDFARPPGEVKVLGAWYGTEEH